MSGNMKTKTALVVSLAINAILVAAIAYIMSLDTNVKTPPAIIFISKSGPSLPWADLLVND